MQFRALLYVQWSLLLSTCSGSPNDEDINFSASRIYYGKDVCFLYDTPA